MGHDHTGWMQHRPTARFDFDSEFDFAFRPDTYWPDTPTEETFLAGIRGTQRRKIAQEMLDCGAGDGHDSDVDILFDPTLGEADRKRWGAVNPANLGGEFLPDFDEDEVEIARIELESTTADVFEIRVRREPNGMRYRVLDEYWDDGSRLASPREHSIQPLTLGELIELIDTTRQVTEDWRIPVDPTYAGLFDAAREINFGGDLDPRRLVHFATAHSAFYPTLTSYYRQRANAWLQDALTRWGSR